MPDLADDIRATRPPDGIASRLDLAALHRRADRRRRVGLGVATAPVVAGLAGAVGIGALVLNRPPSVEIDMRVVGSPGASEQETSAELERLRVEMERAEREQRRIEHERRRVEMERRLLEEQRRLERLLGELSADRDQLQAELAARIAQVAHLRDTLGFPEDQDP